MSEDQIAKNVAAGELERQTEAPFVELDDTLGPKFPHVEVQLSGEDGNAFFIIGRVQRAMKDAGVGAPECKRFMDEATSGDYDHLLQTCMRWVTVL